MFGGNMMEYYTYEQLVNDAYGLQRRYSGLIECETIGYSVCGRAIVMLRVGCGQINMFLTGGVHGRESINPYLLMRIIKRFVTKYYNKDIYRKYCFNIIPLVNPDGYIKAMAEPDNYGYKYNHNGIDINRDFPSKLWNNSSVNCKEPASQPETRAVISAFKSHPSFMYVDVHSRGNCIYYYRHAMSDDYNIRQLSMARIIEKYTKYVICRPEDEVDNGDTGGNSVHYYSEHFNMPAFTIETAPDGASFPMNSNLIDEVYPCIAMLPEAMIQCYNLI